jgi:hypothetical protein
MYSRVPDVGRVSYSAKCCSNANSIGQMIGKTAACRRGRQRELMPDGTALSSGRRARIDKPARTRHALLHRCRRKQRGSLFDANAALQKVGLPGFSRPLAVR